MLKNLLLFLVICLSVPAIAQHKVGVRAGLNYSTFQGDLEAGEDYGIGGGFHFGINYTYQLNDIIGFRGELLYTQRGSKQSCFSEETYHWINPIGLDQFVEYGQVDLNMDISNAYFSIPFTAHINLSKKIEFFGGASLDFLIGPSGRGKVDFVSRDNPDNIFYVQSYDHRYNSDLAGQYNTFISQRISIIVDGDRVELPKIVGGYYNFSSEQKTGNRFNGFDIHAIAGFNYFINTNFYIGARLEYGMMDLTNDDMDYSLNEIGQDSQYIFRADSDRSLSIAVSFGFRF